MYVVQGGSKGLNLWLMDYQCNATKLGVNYGQVHAKAFILMIVFSNKLLKIYANKGKQAEAHCFKISRKRTI